MNASIQKQVLTLGDATTITWQLTTQAGEESQVVVYNTLPEAMNATVTYFSQIPDPA